MGFDISSALGNLGIADQTGAVSASDSSTPVHDLSEHHTGERVQPAKTQVGFLSQMQGGKGLMFDAVLILIVAMILLWAFGAGVFRTHNLG